MKLGGNMDYHGSRAYAPDVPSSKGSTWLLRLTAKLAAWAKEKLELLLRSGSEQAANTIWLVHGDERHFSVLGAEPDKKTRPAAASPWPVSDDELRAHRLSSNR